MGGRFEQRRRGRWREEVDDDDSSDSGLPVLRVDPDVLMRGGLYDTPAGWRAAIEELGLGGLPLGQAPQTLQAVVQGRPDMAWRRQRWWWFLAGMALPLLGGIGLVAFGEDPFMVALAMLQLGACASFVTFMVGRTIYDRSRARSARGRDVAVSAVDVVFQRKWRDVLKALAVDPVAFRAPHAVVDGTVPARRALRSWGDWLETQRSSLPEMLDEVRAGKELVSELGSLGGERGGEAEAELQRLSERTEALLARIDDLREKLATSDRDLYRALRRAGAEPVGGLQTVSLRPLFEELAAVHRESAILAGAWAARVGSR